MPEEVWVVSWAEDPELLTVVDVFSTLERAQQESENLLDGAGPVKWVKSTESGYETYSYHDKSNAFRIERMKVRD